LVRTEGIITQLVFSHALRVRVKAELPIDTSSECNRSIVAGHPYSESIAETSEGPNGSSNDTVSQSTSTDATSINESRKGKQKAKDPQLTAHTPIPKETSADNLVGKINNLVTTDLNNITEARDFLNLSEYTVHFMRCFSCMVILSTVVYIPLQIGLSIWFLYTVLGWSAFVGLFIMVILFPVPGYFATRIQSVQVTRMKKVGRFVNLMPRILLIVDPIDRYTSANCH